MTAHNLTLADGRKMIVLSKHKNIDDLKRELELTKGWVFSGTTR